MTAALKSCPTCADNEPMFVPALTVFDKIDDEIESEEYYLGFYGRMKPHPQLQEKCEEYRKLMWWMAGQSDSPSGVGVDPRRVAKGRGLRAAVQD